MYFKVVSSKFSNFNSLFGRIEVSVLNSFANENNYETNKNLTVKQTNSLLVKLKNKTIKLK